MIQFPQNSALTPRTCPECGSEEVRKHPHGGIECRRCGYHGEENGHNSDRLSVFEEPKEDD